MRTMIDLGSQRSGGPLHIIETATSVGVECGREVRFRRSFRSLVECMVPCCGFQPSSSSSSSASSSSDDSMISTCSNDCITGTFFGYRKGRVSFCLQDDTRSAPLLLVELGVPTAYLAREMQYGVLRIALECLWDRQKKRSGSLLNAPVWSMYCNGRKVGFAIRRQMTVNDAALLKTMQSVSVGAGVLPLPAAPAAATNNSSNKDSYSNEEEVGELMYLRARFQRVIGSADSQSFHMLNPVGSSGQELSIFLLRSS